MTAHPTLSGAAPSPVSGRAAPTFLVRPGNPPVDVRPAVSGQPTAVSISARWAPCRLLRGTDRAHLRRRVGAAPGAVHTPGVRASGRRSVAAFAARVRPAATAGTDRSAGGL
jgi:hypothetical protein